MTAFKHVTNGLYKICVIVSARNYTELVEDYQSEELPMIKNDQQLYAYITRKKYDLPMVSACSLFCLRFGDGLSDVTIRCKD